jgi:hypothetical protein
MAAIIRSDNGLVNSINRRFAQKTLVVEWRLLYSYCLLLSRPVSSRCSTLLQTCMSRFLSGFIRLTGPLGNSGGFHPMSGGSGQCSRFSYGDDQSVLLNSFFCERILRKQHCLRKPAMLFSFLRRFFWLLAHRGPEFVCGRNLILPDRCVGGTLSFH